MLLYYFWQQLSYSFVIVHNIFYPLQNVMGVIMISRCDYYHCQKHNYCCKIHINHCDHD